MECKNCRNTIDANFCSHCGQRTTISAINFGMLKDEFQDKIFQINRGFLFTVKELALRPGHAIRGFIGGKRKPYYKPLSFLIICTTLYVFVSYLFDVDSFIARFINNVKEGWDNAKQDIDKLELTDGGIVQWLQTNQIYLVFVFVPVYSLASYTAFLKAKYNYYEHLVLQLYITGQQFVMITLVTCAFFFNHEILATIVLISSVLYSLITYWQFFEEKTFINIFLRYILIQIIFIILYIVISIVVVFIGVGISKSLQF